MNQSNLLGAQRAPARAAGRDTGTLGPSDSSDSGSDLMGIDAGDIDDPNEPVDAALDDDATRALMPVDAMAGGGSDAAGTGERRSAGGDSGQADGSDIDVDRIFTPGAGASAVMDGAEAAGLEAGEVNGDKLDEDVSQDARHAP